MRCDGPAGLAARAGQDVRTPALAAEEVEGGGHTARGAPEVEPGRVRHGDPGPGHAPVGHRGHLGTQRFERGSDHSPRQIAV